MMRTVLLILLALAVSAGVPGQTGKKRKAGKNDEPRTQAIEWPKEPPAVVIADLSRVTFELSPLSSKGLLSQQLREGLKWLFRQDRPVVRLRAFVAGTGDCRRVQAVVSDVFSEKRMALPALTVVQVGALPQEGAQVVLEATLLDKKTVNPKGLVFIPAVRAMSDQPLQPAGPLAEKALDGLAAAMKAASADPEQALRVSCYLTALDDAAGIRAGAARRFPHAALNFVQPLRAALQSGASCDAVAIPAAAPGKRIASPGGAVAAGPQRAAFTSAQLAFGTSEADARLAFERMARTLEQVKSSYGEAAAIDLYSISRATTELARKTGEGFFSRQALPAVTALPFEGLPSLDASFAIDVIALLSE